LLTILGFCFLIASAFFLRGIGVNDDSLYLKIGELVADGAVPYRDVWENKRQGLLLGGAHRRGGRSALAGAAGVSVLVRPRFFALGDRVHAARVRAGRFPLGRLGLFAFLRDLARLQPSHRSRLRLFGFAGLVLVCGRRRQSPVAWLGAGVFIGLAFLFKQYAAFYGLGLSLSLLLLAVVGHATWRDTVCRGTALAVGFAMVLAAGIGLANGKECGQSATKRLSPTPSSSPLSLSSYGTPSGLADASGRTAAAVALLVLLGSSGVRQTWTKHPDGAGLWMLAVTGWLLSCPPSGSPLPRGTTAASRWFHWQSLARPYCRRGGKA